MTRAKVFLTATAVANLATVIWHLWLVVKLQPDTPVAKYVRLGSIVAVLTLVGLALLWTGWQKAGATVLGIMFAIGFVIGTPEHYLVAGPSNVFDVGVGAWTLLFKTSAAVLVVLEIAGMFTSGRMLVARRAA